MSNIVAIDKKNALSFSSFGDLGGDQFRPRSVLHGDRFRELDMRESYYTCTMHDSKLYDFDGRVVGGPKSVQPLISSEKSPTYIPMKMRRPSTPYRMGKIIVDSFTNLLFGENRFPALRVESDLQTQDFDQAVSRVGRLPMTMIRARQLGGSMGSVGLSWCFHQGSPRFEVHNAKNLHVHTWIDRVALLPRHATEVYLFYKVKWDGKAFNKQFYWFRRDWTPDGDFVFLDVPFIQGKDPVWQIDEEKSNRHGDGLPHFEWIQNLPSDEIDGLPDYDGLYEQFDQLDILNSVIIRGAILNLDPTLKLKMDPDMLNRTPIRKGSDNALVVGLSGDAEYMELNGSSIEAGIKLLETLRRSILETAQCIVPDPHEVASQGVSSITIKALFAPMLAKADVLREQYAAPIKRVLENMNAVARAKMSVPQVQVTIDPETGMEQEEQVQFVLNLPPRLEKQLQTRPFIDPATGQPSAEPVIDPATGVQAVDPFTGQPQTRPVIEDVEVEVWVPRMPGPGGEIETQWPPFFTPTFEDQAKVVTSMNMATGGKPFLSGDTAVELVSAAFGVDPAQEKKRMEAQGQADGAAQASMFSAGGAGGEVQQLNQLPPGALPRAQEAAPAASQLSPDNAHPLTPESRA